MSYSLNSYNYSFVSNPGGGVTQPISYNTNYNNYNNNNNNPYSQIQQQTLPQSIVSNTDYYGNPQQQQQQQQQPYDNRPASTIGSEQNNINPAYNYNTNNNVHNQIPQAQQFSNQNQGPTRKRRPKANREKKQIHVTPIQGPIYVQDGRVPVVPLFSYPKINNGTFYHIPILWTAMSYALGFEIRGEILRGLPCIKRLNQLFCPTAGTTYPVQRIEAFIDENKALIRRMYGEFIMADVGGPLGGNSLRRNVREIYEDEVPNFFKEGAFTNREYGFANSNRTKRQTVNPKNGAPTTLPKSNRLDSCESTTDITTPYWAANSAGKVRAIVNTQHFEQAIHQEICAKSQTKRCQNDCGCEQKYKWHRLLAYDPENDCKGIFMDWFLFPSCCLCRCDK